LSAKANRVKGITGIRLVLNLTSFKNSGLIKPAPGVVYHVRGSVANSRAFETHYFAKGERYPRVSIVLPGRDPMIKPGRTCNVVILDFREARMAKVIDANGEPAIRIHEKMLRSLGLIPNGNEPSGSLVVEFGLKASDGELRRLYTTHKKGYRRVTVLVDRTFARVGEKVELLGARIYALKDFLSDFDHFRPETLPHLIFHGTENALGLRLDDKETPLLSQALSAHYSTVVLIGKLGCTGIRICFGFDGQKVRAWLYKSKLITRVVDTKYGLDIEYLEGDTRRHVLEPTIWKNGLTNDADGEAGAWAWRDVSDWIDTEGLFGIYPRKRSYSVQVVQKESRPLRGLASFVCSAGIPCRLKRNKRGIYTAVITGLVNVAKVIRETEPYIKTHNKQRQIKRFKNSLLKDKKSWKASTLAARGILGI
jgi:hypothetical protein